MVREESEASRVLHLLGQSIGVISLGRHIVLIEGENTSLDKQTYGAIIGNDHPDLVLVSAGGRESLETFASSLDTVLNKTIWGVDFFVLCDGDAAVSASRMDELQTGTKGRLQRLPRYHVENYFLDGHVLAKIFQRLNDPPESWLCDPEKIEERLKEFAKPLISYAAALRVSHQTRLLVGNVNVLPKGCDNKSLSDLKGLFQSRTKEENARVMTCLDSDMLNALVEEEYKRLEQSVDKGSEEWKRLIPGRPVFQRFARESNMDVGRLKTLYIKASMECKPDPFVEIRRIFESFTTMAGVSSKKDQTSG